LELSGYGVEGGDYRSGQGEFKVAELGLELNVRLRPDLKRTDGQPFTGYDLSQYLAQLVTDQPDSLLAQLLDRTTVRAVHQVDIALRRPHVRPEVLLSQPITMRDPSDGSWSLKAIAPYRIADRSEQLVRFQLNDAFQAPGRTGPSEITEQTFPQVSAAVGALVRGEVLVVDRLNPWDVESTQNLAGIVVSAYAVPTVHVLVPNFKNPLLQKRIFRRALVYGINREAILQVQLLRGAQLSDTRVTSGPFPVGYAYNDQVETRPYEPRMAMMLAEIAVKEVAAAADPEAPPAANAAASAAVKPEDASAVESAVGDDVGSEPNDDPQAESPTAPTSPVGAPAPTLRLAHPATEVARLACRAIQRQLKLIGMEVELFELGTQSVSQAVEEYDLVYVALQLEEPIADARRLFGADGLAGGSSPHLEEALVRLEAAVDWKSAREALQRVHRIAADDVAIIPLWQLGEHFAHRTGVLGIPERPVLLYQDVDHWQVEPYLPPAKP
jgi:ABC-type transport system substrate-binding protein